MLLPPICVLDIAGTLDTADAAEPHLIESSGAVGGVPKDAGFQNVDFA